MEMLKTGLIIAGATYVLLMIVITVFQSKFIYYPDTKVQVTPEKMGMGFEDVSLSSGGETLHGWFVAAEADLGTILFCHGNAGNISHRLDTLKLFNDLGYNTFIFDYRGYGKSTGKTTEQGTREDALAVWTYLVNDRGVSPNRLVVFGRSLGGAVATRLASEKSVAGLFLESTFTSAKDMAKRSFPIFPVGFLLRYSYDNVKDIQGVKVPILIGHSVDDGVVPFRYGKRLFDVAPEPKEFFQFSGAHNCGFLDDREAYMKIAGAFLGRVIPPK